MQGAQWLVALAAGARQRDSLSRKGVSCGGGARWQLAAVPQHGPARSQRLAARLCGVTGGMGMRGAAPVRATGPAFFK